MELSAISHNASKKDCFAFMKKLREEKVVVCFHARQGLVNLPQLAGMTNILNDTSFDGILRDYETAVLR